MMITTMNIKKNIVRFCAGFCMSALTGCGHNAIQYSDGVGVEVGFIPEQYQIALNFRYGKIFSAVVKEKTEVSLMTDASNEGTAGSSTEASASGKAATNTKTTLTLKTGDQTTGYVVDLEKVKGKQAESGGGTVQ